MAQKAAFGVTWSAVEAVVRERGWESERTKVHELLGLPTDVWRGPCPIPKGRRLAAEKRLDGDCRIERGRDPDGQEVLMSCDACNPGSGHLKERGFTYLDHLKALGLA